MSQDKTSPQTATSGKSTDLARRLWRDFVSAHMSTLGFALVLMLLAGATTAAMAKLMEPIIDKVFSGGNAAMIWPVALAVMGVFTLRGFATYGHTLLMNKLGQEVVSDIQRRMFAHLIYSDVSFFHGEQSGRLLSRFLTDTALIRTATTEALVGFGKNAFTLVFLIGVMFYQDWKLSLISLFVFPLAAYVVARLSKKLRRVSTHMQQETGELTALLGQAFQGNKHVKAYGMERFEIERIGSAIQRIFDLTYKAYKVSGRAVPLSEMLSGLAIVTIIVYGGYQVMAGVSTAGKLFSFITAFLLAYEPMKRLARLNNIMQMGFAAIDRLYELLDQPPAVGDKPEAREFKTANPAVSIEDVHFRYADGTEALRGLSLVAPAGKTVALVGASGSGKSTLLNLIPRFYDVESGRISVDSIDIRDIRLASLRSQMAFVSQEVAIFNDTIRDNIAYGRPGASEDDIIAAAKDAAAHEFIAELPQGYDTIVGENGVKLSGGQRQRLSIARAFLRNAPILLLDEATSALDSQSERLVQSAIERLQKGKTTIVVAHRLSTIINADMIYVLEQGRVVEQGDHASLLSKNGIYARFYGTLMKESA